MNLAKSFFCLAILALVSFGGIVMAQESSTPKSAAEVVKAQPYVSLDPVPRGKAFEAAVVVHIAEGYHMNSHKPSDTYLIPTTLTPRVPAGFRLVDTMYPPGSLKKFAFSPDKPLDVYSGSVTLRLKLMAEDTAAIGATTIPMTLRYQACNNSACLPPVKVPVTAALRVAAAGSAAKPVHPDIFAAPAHN
ncbi:MAG TPA: protein-disulfide reductase DsbD domain-containing protein [Candidatus Acidoferrales bacterium]